MAYFEDLSDYVYVASACRQRTRNVGWLDPGHKFDSATPSEGSLNQLWEHCRISVVATRGIHLCEFCDPASEVFAERKGQRIRLGASEIRVWSKTGDLYSAPNLIFHYVHTHRYKPPDEFLRALQAGISPSSTEYFEKLKDAELDWTEAPAPPDKQMVYKFLKVDDEIRRIEVPFSIELCSNTSCITMRSATTRVKRI
jgi:hypothetical protein